MEKGNPETALAELRCCLSKNSSFFALARTSKTDSVDDLYKYRFCVRNMRSVLVCLFALVLSATVFGAGSQEEQELLELEKAVADANKQCVKLEHDIVYEDAECKAAYQEVKKAEKELLRKREILADKLEQNPAIHQARAERKKAYDRLKAFKKRTGMLQRKEKK